MKGQTSKEPQKRRWLRRLAIVLGVGFLLLNVVAFLHAHAMLHFAAAETVRTEEPDELGFWQKAKVLFTGVKIPRPINRKTPESVGLPFETVNFAGAHGLKLEVWHVRAPASKGAVILFHGYAGCKDSLLAEAKEFFELGYDAWLVDFFGSGGSEGNDTSVGYYEADDVAAAFAYVRAELAHQPIYLYGVSMGAAAILRAVHIYQLPTEGVILECPFDRLFTTVKNRFALMKLPVFPAAYFLTFWGGVDQGFNAFGFSPADDARGVPCPVLLMHGGRDARVRMSEMDHIARNLNDKSVCKIFPGLGHQSYLAVQPEPWREYVQRFLALATEPKPQ